VVFGANRLGSKVGLPFQSLLSCEKIKVHDLRLGNHAEAITSDGIFGSDSGAGVCLESKFSSPGFHPPNEDRSGFQITPAASRRGGWETITPDGFKGRHKADRLTSGIQE